jgi:hypothetical protein
MFYGVPYVDSVSVAAPSSVLVLLFGLLVDENTAGTNSKRVPHG